MAEMQKYNINMRIMHWLIGLIIISMLGVGLYMVDLPDTHPDKWTLYDLHKSFGVTVLVLIFIRLFIRLGSTIPLLPSEISRVEANLSKMGILLLYVCMFAMPLSGYISSDAGGYGVKWFSFAMPKFFAVKDEWLAHFAITIHKYVAYFLITILTLHIIAPLKHLMVDKVNILKRIV